MTRRIDSGLIRKALIYGFVTELLTLAVLYFGGGIGHAGPNGLMSLIPSLLNLPGFLVWAMLADFLPVYLCIFMSFSLQVVLFAAVTLLILIWRKSGEPNNKPKVAKYFNLD